MRASLFYFDSYLFLGAFSSSSSSADVLCPSFILLPSKLYPYQHRKGLRRDGKQAFEE